MKRSKLRMRVSWNSRELTQGQREVSCPPGSVFIVIQMRQWPARSILAIPSAKDAFRGGGGCVGGCHCGFKVVVVTGQADGAAGCGAHCVGDEVHGWVGAEGGCH